MVSMKDIKSKGGTCEKVATDWWICKDDGGTTWWCSDSGRECVKAPMSVRPTPTRWPLWKDQAVSQTVVDIGIREDPLGRALLTLTVAVVPLEAASREPSDRYKRISEALLWVQENKHTRDAAIEAVSSSDRAMPDVLLGNPSSVVQAAVAAAKGAVASGAPEGVVSTLQEIVRQYEKGERRLTEIEYSVRAVKSLQGLRDRTEVEGPLLRALAEAPDEANREKLSQIVALVKRPPSLSAAFPSLGAKDDGCSWGCCAFSCILCAEACVVCCIAACLLC